MTYVIIGVILLIICGALIGLLWGVDEIDGEQAFYAFLIAALCCSIWFITLALAVLAAPVFIGKWYASRKR